MRSHATDLHVKLAPNPAVWLAEMAKAAGVSRSKVINDALLLLTVVVARHGETGSMAFAFGHYYRRSNIDPLSMYEQPLAIADDRKDE